AVARDLFHQSVEMTIIEQNKEDIGFNQSQQHTAFRVVLRVDGLYSELQLHQSQSSLGSRSLVEFNPQTVLLRASDFCAAFPYHIIFDKDLRISIVHPKMVLTIDNIRKFINAVFLLALTPNHQQNGRKTFLLKGQMIWLSDTKHMIFIGSPRLTSLNELMEMNVYLADIPLYDVTRELVLLNQQRIAEIDIAKRLDETTAELKKTSTALEVEKSKTETLLYEMLPRKVAKALTEGRKVEAEKFDQVTVLFSDIVTFTNIAAACSPMDIVNMLNEMYQRFDELTSQHKVYKVETIGDAYMIVSGVPETTAVHAQLVANFAMDMVEEAGLVKSPATSLPLQIRVGVHTGPVVAGVVGVKMPRYCLFGDTVNTASRMESHGVPGRIHLSPTTYTALRAWGYVFKSRGEMEVKGKGKMATYFLCGHLQRRLEELDDDWAKLESYQDSTENGEYVVGPSGISQDDLASIGADSDRERGHLASGKEVDTTFDTDEPSGDEDNDGDDEAVNGDSCDEEELQSDHTVDEKIDEVEKDEKQGSLRKRRVSSELDAISDKAKPARRKISSQSLASGSQNGVQSCKLKRNRRISRSCNDTAAINSTLPLPPQPTEVTLATENKVLVSSAEGNDSKDRIGVDDANSSECIYVNGSFKNTYGNSQNANKVSSTRSNVSPTQLNPSAASEAMNDNMNSNNEAHDKLNDAKSTSTGAGDQNLTVSPIRTVTAQSIRAGGSEPSGAERDICLSPVNASGLAGKARGRGQVHPCKQAIPRGDQEIENTDFPYLQGEQPQRSPDNLHTSMDHTPPTSIPSSMKKSQSSPAAHVTWGPCPEMYLPSASHSSIECLGRPGERTPLGNRKTKKKKKSKSPSKLCSIC
ncbi:guanylate cyclase soluble subunit beta-2-like, partial [Plakobranchus ocellatus]